MGNLIKTVERATVQALIDHFYDNISDPAERSMTLQKIADTIPFFYKDLSSEDMYPTKLELSDPDSRIMQFLNAILDDVDPDLQHALCRMLVGHIRS